MSNVFNTVLCGIFLLCLGCSDNPKKGTGDAESTPASSGDVAPHVLQDEKGNKTILFFGNSLTAAYGLDLAQGFVGIIQRRIDSLGLDYKVVNAGLSGETSAGGDNRIDWLLRQSVDILVLELGANDGLRGIPPEETRRNLQSIIDKVRKKYPQARIIIAGMEAPPNMGKDFIREFRAVFPALASTHNTRLIPFLLKDVAGEPELNLPDGIHPTAEGHRIVAENVWKVLKEVL